MAACIPFNPLFFLPYASQMTLISKCEEDMVLANAIAHSVFDVTDPCRLHAVLSTSKINTKQIIEIRQKHLRVRCCRLLSIRCSNSL